MSKESIEFLQFMGDYTTLARIIELDDIPSSRLLQLKDLLTIELKRRNV